MFKRKGNGGLWSCRTGPGSPFFWYASFLYFLKRVVFVKWHVSFFRIYSNIVRKRILFFPGKAFSQMLGNMSVTKMVVPDTDYTDGSSNGGGDNSNPSGGNDGDQGENPLG